jgi:hypothetical protein
MQINRLWTAMLTRESRNSETDSSIHVSVNTNGVERLNHTFRIHSRPIRSGELLICTMST